MNGLHLTDTLWVVILYPALNVYNLVLMRNFFEGIPSSLFEAATLDGCSPLQTFIRVVLPMSKAALSSIGLMFAVSYWNDYTHYRLYIRNSDLYNFQMKLRGMIMGSELPTVSGNATENTLKNAAVIVVIVPFMILMEKRCLNLAVSFILKEWKEDTGAELLWAGDGGTVGEGSAPLTGDGKGTFTGVLEIPLDRGRLEFTLALITRDGEDERRENLDGVYDTGELLPVQCGFQGEQVEYLKGVFTVYECEADLYGRAETEGHVFRLRRNDEIVMEQVAEPGDRSNRYFCGKLSSEAQPGDQMALTFFCRDENGLGYEFMLRNWIAVEERDVARGSSEWEDWLKLTWD